MSYVAAGGRSLGMVGAGPNATGGFYGRRGGAVAVGPGGAVGGVGGGSFVGGVGGMPGGPVGGIGGVGPGYGYGDADCCGNSYGPGYGGGIGGGSFVGGGGADCCGVACAPGPGAACANGCAAVGCGGAACGGGGGGSILTFVGAGGDYVQETTYRYVGGGAGTFGLVPIGTPTNCCCWFIPLGLCLLLLPLLLLFLMGSATTTTTTPPPLFSTTTPFIPPFIQSTTTQPGGGGLIGACIIFGDPHIKTFDGRHISFYSRGEYWVVRSTQIWIQARYMSTPVTHGLSATKEIAIGGPFLDGKVLRVSALAASFDGQPILTTFPSTFTNTNPAIIAEYNSDGGVLQPGRQGKPVRAVHLGLPLGVSLQINRWNEPGEGDYINVQITMPQQPAQDGHCGNFNGNIEDDRRLAIRARVGTTGVAPNELLFNTKTPVVAPNRPDLNNCPEAKANHAKALCKSVAKNGMASHDCMVDVCFGGDQFAYEEDYE